MWGDTVNDSSGLAARSWKLAAFDHILADIAPVKERCEGRNAGRCDAGNTLESFECDTVEGGNPLTVRVAGGGEHHGSGHDVLGLPAGASIIQLIETAGKKRGAGE